MDTVCSLLRVCFAAVLAFSFGSWCFTILTPPRIHRSTDKYGIIDERAELKQVINTWYRFALEDGKKDFNSGLSVPDLTDLTVFGTLRSVEGLPAHEEFVANGPIDAWYERMKKEVEKN